MIDHKIQRLSESLEVSRSENLETESDQSSIAGLFAATTTSPAESQITISALSNMHPPSGPSFFGEADSMPTPTNVGGFRTEVFSVLTPNNQAAWESHAFRVALAADELLGESRPAPIFDGPESSPIQPPVPEDQNQFVFNSPWTSAIELAINDLSTRLDVKIGEINLNSFEQVVWADGSIGCPKAGYGYTLALVDGYRIKLELDGELFYYHGSIRKNEFYRDNEFFDLPDTVYDPIFCDDPWPSLTDFRIKSREQLREEFRVIRDYDNSRLTLDAPDSGGVAQIDVLSSALRRQDVLPGLISPG
ncbi:MAG: hypothetical protein ACR2NP_12105 [Pirellulaceae bacterium]